MVRKTERKREKMNEKIVWNSFLIFFIWFFFTCLFIIFLSTFLLLLLFLLPYFFLSLLFYFLSFILSLLFLSFFEDGDTVDLTDSNGVIISSCSRNANESSVTKTIANHPRQLFLLKAIASCCYFRLLSLFLLILSTSFQWKGLTIDSFIFTMIFDFLSRFLSFLFLFLTHFLSIFFLLLLFLDYLVIGYMDQLIN